MNETVLVLTPRGRDTEVATDLLKRHGIKAIRCEQLTGLSAAIERGAGAALVAEEALAGIDLDVLTNHLEQQPPWSDFPFIILANGHKGVRSSRAFETLDRLRNVVLLERPLHAESMVRAVRSALNARRRQYEARDVLARSREDLERLVAERTREREEALAQLHEAQKLETIGQLTGGVAHDFNNLLTPVMGNLDMLRRRIPADDLRSQRLIENALQATGRAATLVQRLVAFAAPTTLPAARVDPSQLELALLNLAINARDAMPRGGRLTMEVRLDEVRGGRGDRLDEGDYIRISVIDTGVGMDASTLKRAVEPFFSTKGLGKGTGLGLSMVHGLAAQSGGALMLSSTPGVGTRAELWLPVADEAAAANEPLHVETVLAARPSTVLLVDDEELVRIGTAETLTDLGYSVIQAGSGVEALAALRRGEVEIDLLVSDYLMPGMNGADVVHEARRLRPDLPTLLMTGYTNLVQGAGAELPRLAKPFRQAELAARIAELMEAAAARDNVVGIREDRRAWRAR